MEFLLFVLLGLGTGGVYALVAAGIVLVYRSSGVLNFAAGATGGVAAFLFFDLRDDLGVPAPVALVVALLAGAAIGAAVQLLVMSRLREASPLTRLIATLGVLTLLTGVATEIWGPDQLLVAGVLPDGSVTLAAGLTVGIDRLVLIALALAVTLVLWLVYSRTTVGLATSAVAENRRAAAALGWSSSRIELANWTAGGALSALAAILFASTTGLQAGTIGLVVVPALAAALIGRFSSFGRTLLGAMLLGVLQAELARYVSLPGVGDSVPFVVIIVVLVAGGRLRPARGDLPTRLPLPGTGRISPAGVVIAGLALALVVWTVPDTWADSMTTLFVWGIVVLSVVVVAGFAGQASLGQWALAGFGAWVAAVLTAGAGLPFPVAAALGVLAAVPAGLVVALPAMRTRGVELAIATLGLALVLLAMVLNNGDLAGGLDGIDIGSPTLFGVPVDAIAHPHRYATLALVAFVVLGLLVANLRRGRSGRRMLAVRSNERAAASVGIGVYGVKLYAFGLAAAIAAVAGVLAAFRTPIVVFSQFDVFGSVNALMFAVVGGLGWPSGALLGATMAPGTPFGKAIEMIGDVAAWLPIIGGLAVILMLIGNPVGLAEPNARLLRPVARRLERAVPDVVVAAHTGRVVPAGGVLTVRGLSVRYGGVQALEAVDLRVRSGEVLGLIGPNGAGKTTLLDAVTGFTATTAGTVELDGTSVAGWSPVRRARAGIGRSFQAVELFDDMTVRENLLAAVGNGDRLAYATDLVRPGRGALTPVIRRAVDELGLAGLLEKLPGELSHGAARLVGVARALAAEPRILFLDEPAAGLDPAESEELGLMVRRIAEEWGIGVVLVEHDVPLVMRTCDRVTVLDFGRVIAEGSPGEVRDDPAVVAAYLGRPVGAASAIATSPRDAVPGAIMTATGPRDADGGRL